MGKGKKEYGYRITSICISHIVSLVKDQTFLFCAFPSSSDLYSIFERRVMQPDPRQLEDISSIRDAVIRMSQTAFLAVELLDAKIENEI